MARLESACPIEERYLWLEGRASATAVKMLRGGLPDQFSPNTGIFFVGFSYPDLPVGKTFSVAFPKDKPLETVDCRCQIIAVTQQLGQSFDGIPHGWKTVCAIEFPCGLPAMVRALPTIETWFQNLSPVCITEPATVAALVNRL